MRRVVLLLFLVEVFGDQSPTSPCPNVFTYETDSESVKGLITIRTPFKYPKVQLSLRLILSFTQQLDRKHLASIYIKGRRLAIYDEGVQVPNGKGGFLEYYVHFSPEIPVPTLLSLVVDGQELCDPQKDPPNWRHRVILDYNFKGTNGAVKESRSTKSEVREIEDFKDCGVRLPLDDVNVDAKRFDWPWLVAMFKTSDKGFLFICAGTLVTRRHIVTAAHCVNGTAPSSLSVLLGKTNIGTFYEEGQQGSEVKKIVVHPDYEEGTLLYDIALIELKKPVLVSNYVRPACLWDSPYTLLRDVLGRIGWVPGWRMNETEHLSKDLIAIGMPIVSQEDCLRSDEFFLRYTNRDTFCAGFRNGTSICRGDSGGGLFLNEVGPEPGQNTWFLKGVVSKSKVNSDHKCDTASYAIFTDVTMFADWLKTHIQKE